MLLAKMYIVVSNIALLLDGDDSSWFKNIWDNVTGFISGLPEHLQMGMDFVEAAMQAISTMMVKAFGGLVNDFVAKGFSDYSDIMEKSLQYLNNDFSEGPLGELQAKAISASTTVIVPIAALIVTYSFMYNLIQIMVDRNNQAEIDWFMICKECFKAACCAVLVTHSFEIAGAMKELGNYIAGEALSIGSYKVTMTADLIGESYSTGGQMVLVALVGLISVVCGFVCAALIRFTIYTRIITLNLLIGLAPIPFATFLAGGWIGQIGQGYIKSLMSYVLQLFIMALIATFISEVLGSATIEPSLGSMLEHIIMLFALTQTFMKSLSIAKTVMSAA